MEVESSVSQLRQRKNFPLLRETTNPIESFEDIEVDFHSSTLGIKVSPKEDDRGLRVSEVTKDATENVRKLIRPGYEIIQVNEHKIESAPFNDSVELFRRLTLPIRVKFRPAKNNSQNMNKTDKGHHHHDHHHHHNHSHRGDDEDDSCAIAGVLCLFVLVFMFVVFLLLNGFPTMSLSTKM
ncbi:E3 ubiquitin ligase triad3 [Reticulomyxa filosa]|uniref:E3 ubiquitin ligase triad3 n=1 Tax=Reticulomyxa filosa TaxID=46433 RepID=X6P689_RETFI|nr:E3 ubiquitin ligase triad3 [Reticulomyxa filosa]|eukprot:ETO33628.1 E3 ubiquitin ligase triad3 [Reticulomyxa filosa]